MNRPVATEGQGSEREMNEGLKAVLQGMEQQPQRQDATNDQLRDLADFAVRLGMYDAQDVLKLLIARGLGADRKGQLQRGSMAERERCIAAVLSERVDADGSGAEEDRAYNRALDHAVQAIRALPQEPGATDPKTARESMLAELRNPWQGANESRDADAEVQRLYRLCQAAATVLEAGSGG